LGFGYARLWTFHHLAIIVENKGVEFQHLNDAYITKHVTISNENNDIFDGVANANQHWRKDGHKSSTR
jgi:hypothetical protein